MLQYVEKEQKNKNVGVKMIKGENVFLREIEDRDTADIVRWRNKSSIRKNFVSQDLFTEESHREYLKTKVYKGLVKQFIICEMATEKPIGSVYFRDIDKENHKAEYGIFIGEESLCGKGVGTEAGKLALKYAFDTCGIHKVFLRVFADNKRAVNSYKKIGFVEEGYSKDEVYIDGKYRDMIFMAIFNGGQANED